LRIRPFPPSIEVTLRNTGVSFEAVESKVAFTIQRAWLTRFATQVKQQKGTWVFRGLMWHGFSYEIQPCQVGKAALKAYQSRQIEPYHVFAENVRDCYACISEDWPDFSGGNEVYVLPCSAEWTMVFTHEQSRGLGPYFAEAELPPVEREETPEAQ
jgi:hypothetical protein